jgi:hypothetical protein
MAKIFTTNGTGASQTLDEASSNRIKVYDDFDSIDKTALADGEVVSTKENGAGGNVYDYVKDYVEEQIADAQSYSTEETLTGGTWIDGKPIYRKVILNPTFNTTLLTGVDEVVNYRVKRQVYSETPQGYIYFEGESNNIYNTTIYISLANNEVKINSIHSGPYFNAQWVVLEYTKA